MKKVTCVLGVLALVGAMSVAASAQQAGGGTLGVTFKSKSLLGALVTDVVPGSAAERAGLQAGDRILAINKAKVDNYGDVVKMIGAMTPNTNVQLLINRDGVQGTVPVTLGGQGVFNAMPVSARTSSAQPLEVYEISDQRGYSS
jgi:S1-C subfamily serine protease